MGTEPFDDGSAPAHELAGDATPLHLALVGSRSEQLAFLQRALQGAGFDPVEVLSGDGDVAEAAARSGADAVVVDVGTEAATDLVRRLRAMDVELGATQDPGASASRALPTVVVLTDDHRARTRDGLLDAGAREVLVKPFDLTELVLRLSCVARDRADHLDVLRQREDLGAMLDEQVRERMRDRERYLENLVEVQESVRERLAADIHDEALQNLAAVALRLEVLDRRLREERCEPGEAPDEVRLAVINVRETAEKLRTLLFDAQPPLQAEALLEGLKDRVEAMVAGRQIRVFVSNEFGEQLSPTAAVVLWRIGLEAIANAVKHSQASSLLLKMSSEDEVVRLIVLDDGVGFELDDATAGASPAAKRHVGLRVMSQRASEHGGEVRVTSRPGQGTRVDAQVPLHPPTFR